MYTRRVFRTEERVREGARDTHESGLVSRTRIRSEGGGALVVSIYTAQDIWRAKYLKQWGRYEECHLYPPSHNHLGVCVEDNSLSEWILSLIFKYVLVM
jgi:hypothetical protein